MGIRISKAVGYGLPLTEDNLSRVNFTLEDYYEFFYEDVLSTFVIDEYLEKKYPIAHDFYKNNLKNAPENLINEASMEILLFIMTFYSKDTSERKRLAKTMNECFHLVGDYDERPVGLLITHPGHMKEWKRYDDTIDYYSSPINDSPYLTRYIFEPINQGIYPYIYKEYFSEKNNDWRILNYMEEMAIKKIEEKENKINIIDIRYFVPDMLKEILQEIKLFKNDNDIHLLKPYRAEWLS